MATIKRTLHATPEQVWDVLADGWLYPLWVVGASRMREVEPEWPAVGARLHHSVGTWPFLIDDHTEVVECSPGVLLRLKARTWPTGEAGVTLRLRPVGEDTEVVIEEDVTDGPARLIPKPFREPPLKWRNVESLRRLAYIAERRRGS